MVAMFVYLQRAESTLPQRHEGARHTMKTQSHLGPLRLHAFVAKHHICFAHSASRICAGDMGRRVGRTPTA
jgi:hypothetical protein